MLRGRGNSFQVGRRHCYVWVGGGGGLITLAACPLPCLEALSLPLPVQHLGLGLGVSACRAAQKVGGGYSQELFLGFWAGRGEREMEGG